LAKTPYESLLARGLILREERDVTDAFKVYTAIVPGGYRIGVLSDDGNETPVVLDNNAFKRLFG
jgi:hypothetical protein